MRKMIGILACVLLIVTATPLTNAINNENTKVTIYQKNDAIKGLNRIYSTCYIEASGLLNNQWKIMYLKPFNNEFAIVFIWRIFFGEDGATTIYTKENGDVLSEYQGQHNLFLIGFRGDYFHPTDEYYGITISGKAMLVRPGFFSKP